MERIEKWMATLLLFTFPGLTLGAGGMPGMNASRDTLIGPDVPVAAVAQMLPEILADDGFHPIPVSARLLAQVRRRAGQAEGWFWRGTWFVPLSEKGGVTITLPEQVEGIEAGRLLVGWIEAGELVFLLGTSIVDGRIVLSLPEGTETFPFDPEGVLQGEDAQCARAFLRWLDRNGGYEIDLGPIVAVLQAVQELLRMIADLLDAIICAVNQLVELFERLDGCDADPGVGEGKLRARAHCISDAFGHFAENLPRCF
ncbi:MAG: hypothetical protein D6812_02270 [Deltaproteobacteria bacterium]|nr:MAG: hypothetical protein D6812_02270 [Deltaproteobacteria bacterium]